MRRSPCRAQAGGNCLKRANCQLGGCDHGSSQYVTYLNQSRLPPPPAPPAGTVGLAFDFHAGDYGCVLQTGPEAPGPALATFLKEMATMTQVRLPDCYTAATSLLHAMTQVRLPDCYTAVTKRSPRCYIAVTCDRQAPLSSLDSVWKVMHQTLAPIAPSPPTHVAPAGTVAIPAAANYTFSTRGIEIEGDDTHGVTAT